MKFILSLSIFLFAAAALGVVTTNGMPMNPANSQPGTTVPLNNGTTIPVPTNPGIYTIPPLQAPAASTPVPGPSPY